MTETETKAEFCQEDASEMTREQLTDLALRIQAFITDHGLYVGVTVLIADRDGLKTVGTMSPDMQAAAFATLHERMRDGGEGPDTLSVLAAKGTHEPTH